MKRAPVVVFAYKRVDKLKKCLDALENNLLVDETDLILFSDGAKNDVDKEAVNQVRAYLKEYKISCVFKSIKVFENERNKGLANSIITGVSHVMEYYGKAIVVEDDLITSSDFLLYMNEGLDYYENDMRYGSISAYTYPLRQLAGYDKDVYVTRKGECWGWATWKNRWDSVDWLVADFDDYFSDKYKRNEFNKLQYGIDNMLCSWKSGAIDSWAVRWCYHLFKMEQLTVYPKVSRAKNIGVDGTGTNCGENYIYEVDKIGGNKCIFEKLEVNKKLEHAAAVFEKETIYKKIKRLRKKYFRF